MTAKTFLLTFGCLILLSCNNSRTQAEPKEETPKALQEKNSYSEIISRSRYDDLVENLYRELLDKDNELKELEDNIDALNASRDDTTASFDNFNAKNESYYSASNKHIAQLSDTLLKERMSAIIKNSLTSYNSLIARHNALLKTIKAKNVTLNDLHIVLKITKTIPLIDKYQKDNLPSTKPLEGYIEEQNKSIKLADTLTKK